MRGLKTQESEKFKRFWGLVQDVAASNGSVFFLDCGEGRDFETNVMEGEDLCGWLIPLDKVDEFETEWMDDNVSDKWSDLIMWGEWKDTNGTVTIEFNTH